MPPKKRTAKKATPKPPTPPAPPERTRATKGPRTAPKPRPPAERGKETKPAPKPPTPSAPLPPQPKPAPPARSGGGGPGLLSRVATPKPGATYHRVVLAEFIGALVLAVAGGILSPRKRDDGTPTWVHLIVQVTAIAGVFFVLALLSASPKIGKIAAAFGLLVFLGVLINSADAVRKMAAVFAPAKTPTQAAPAPGTTQPSGAGG